MFRKQFEMLIAALAALLIAADPVSAVDISEIDTNFKAVQKGDVEVHYYNVLDSDVFELTGFPWREPGAPPTRMPKNLQPGDVSNYIAAELNYHASGGAVRFRSNSPAIYLRAELWHGSDMSHMTRGGSAGFDLLIAVGTDGEFTDGTVFPSTPQVKNGELIDVRVSLWKRSAEEMRDYTLYLPLYSGVKTLEIGIEAGSTVEPPLPQRIARPIVFYGSSITQGACASRPANNYTTMLCRAVDAPQVNIGLSGSAEGQLALARAIAELDPAVFVYDYDYNAPTPQFLAQTHEKFFQEFRRLAPDVPVIMMSRCSGAGAERTAIIKKTYDNAVAAGDDRVWFIDGKELFGEPGDLFCRVDPYHPNDLGFYMMYSRVLPVLIEALQASGELQ